MTKHDHHHHHHHHHESEDSAKGQTPANGTAADEELLDIGGRSLSDALRTSFIVLKIIMIVLVALFLVSGFKTVGPDEQAMVLRFGKVRGIGENRIMGPGLHWVLPYPVDQIIKIPVAKKVNLPINSFWYHQTADEILPDGPKNAVRINPKLNPIVDGYCIVRGEKQDRPVTGSAGNDYNIIHSKWQVTYRINDPERFFRNVYAEDPKPGQDYFETIASSVKPLLENLMADAVVAAMVNYSIDDVIPPQARVSDHVEKLLQEKLTLIESGMIVVSLTLNDITWPRQVEEAFQASISASQKSQKTISEARSYAENTVNEAGGPEAEKILDVLKGKLNVSQQEQELLWSQLAGAAQEKIAIARGYRTQVVEAAKANAEYLKNILPEYQKHPQLVIQKIYQDAIEYVLNNADEKMIIQSAHEAKAKELRILLNRDPSIRPKADAGKTK